MTTTFHCETNEPQYEYSYQGADVQLRCAGLVAAAAGPAPALGENVPSTWFELSPASGKRILAGVGRCAPGATAASAFETRETIWANAMAGLVPLELAETSAAVADCAYALVDPTNGLVELGRAGRGASALIFDGEETRLVQPAPSESGVGHSTSFKLSTGSTLLLLTHDPAEREALTAAIQRPLGARSAQGDEVDAVLECCLELRNAPLSQCEAIVALHFERLDGSPVRRSPSDPPPITGEVVHEEALVSDGTSEVELRLHQTRVHPRRCRWKPARRKLQEKSPEDCPKVRGIPRNPTDSDFDVTGRFPGRGAWRPTSPGGEPNRTNSTIP